MCKHVRKREQAQEGGREGKGGRGREREGEGGKEGEGGRERGRGESEIERYAKYSTHIISKRKEVIIKEIRKRKGKGQLTSMCVAISVAIPLTNKT